MSSYQPRGLQSRKPWILRESGEQGRLIAREKGLMRMFFPEFKLEMIDDPSSPFHGAACWTGNTEMSLGLRDGPFHREFLAMYVGIGGGMGDWSGAIAVYFLDSTSEEIINKLGFVPRAMVEDCEGTKCLSNILPFRLQEGSAAAALVYADRFVRKLNSVFRDRIGRPDPDEFEFFRNPRPMQIKELTANITAGLEERYNFYERYQNY